MLLPLKIMTVSDITMKFYKWGLRLCWNNSVKILLFFVSPEKLKHDLKKDLCDQNYTEGLGDIGF